MEADAQQAGDQVRPPAEEDGKEQAGEGRAEEGRKKVTNRNEMAVMRGSNRNCPVGQRLQRQRYGLRF
jgi:hypothetical protein